MANFVPEDIIVNILKRLPVKSLLRFRCVRKNWNDLFKTSFFLKQHFHHSTPSLLLQCFCFMSSFINKQCYLLDSHAQTLVPLHPPLYYCPFFRRARVIGSSYGLLCLLLQGNYYLSLCLWNPATREVHNVPHAANNYGTSCCIGFGFSTVVNDYKIVIIYELESSQQNRVEIYSLSTGSWKEVVKFGNLFESTGFICLKQIFTVTDRAMYFFAYKKDGDEFNVRFIVSFDMAKQVFALISVPCPNFLENRQLITYENKLALLSHNELWVMEEEGSRQRWNKEFFSSNCSPALDPMTIWRDEAVLRRHKLLSTVNKMEVFIYLLNLSTDKLKEILITPHYGYVMGAFNYAESIVSIGNRDSNK